MTGLKKELMVIRWIKQLSNMFHFRIKWLKKTKKNFYHLLNLMEIMEKLSKSK